MTDHLLLVSNAVFDVLVRRSTVVEPNIAIEQTGVTQDGSLRYTEFLPTETMLYSLLRIESPLQKGGATEEILLENVNQMARDLFTEATETMPGDLIQLGADESKGKGLAIIRAYPGWTRKAGGRTAEGEK